MSGGWGWSSDLASGWVAVALALAAASLALLGYELMRGGRSRRAKLAVAATGMLAVVAVGAAALRPVRIIERGITVGASVLILVDGSRSIDLPADSDGVTRAGVIASSLPAVRRRLAGLRLRVMSFGAGAPRPWAASPADSSAPARPRPQLSSDLLAALQAVSRSTGPRPEAIVVMSDGRLGRPGPQHVAGQLAPATAALAVPIHAVSLARRALPDAAIAAVHMSKAAVAHQPVTLSVQVACTGGLACQDVPIVVRELHAAEPPVRRASGVAHLAQGRATVDLQVVLDRAGTRILEAGLTAPGGDRIEDNNRRFIAVDVARDRVRLLHIAGRPTYDVRALRTWLKSDASVDVVAFFILRTHSDDVGATQNELALIPFPVDELFTSHLASFDAVVLQDFDARPYGLSSHLGRLAEYVKQGGGLIMVGGPNAFVSGNYAGTPLATVLPVALDGIERSRAIDLARFTPRYTEAGRLAPVLEPLRALLGDDLPAMPGTNRVGDARPGATVLLTHPSLVTPHGAAMPVLALGEYGSGRSIALTVDGSHRLLFSRFAEEMAGRAHGAFWDALLGWLMRDPRFEPVKVALVEGCLAGERNRLELWAPFLPAATEATVVITRMGSGDVVHRSQLTLPAARRRVALQIDGLGAGGYSAAVRLGGDGHAAPSRYDFACEVGGDEWADPRPDPERLEAIAAASGGVAVAAGDEDELPRPHAARIVAERRVAPWLPPWSWSLIAAIGVGGHWLARRRSGLA